MNYSENNTPGNNFSLDIPGLLRDQRWKPYRLDQTAPHSLRVRDIDGAKFAALVARRKNNDWAISEPALRFVADAVRDGHLREAYVVLVDPKWQYVTHRSLTELIARIGGTSPNDGAFGPYYWINASLSIAAASDEMPW